MVKLITVVVVGLISVVVLGTSAGYSETKTINLPIVFDGESKYTGPWNITRPVSDEEIHCMALNIYFEARSEVLEGQYAVAEVVMYRVMHDDFPDSICSVVKAGVYPKWDLRREMPIKYKCAYSWFCDRKPDVVLDIDAFETAIEVAKNVVLDPGYVPILSYALFYHADYVEPYWAKEMTEQKTIGRHIFY